MHVAKDDVEIRMQIPGATIRQRFDMGDIGGSELSAEYFSLAAGVDTTPLFIGLEENLCQVPHWGFVLQGQLTTTDGGGAEETVAANELFYWPAGHNVRVEKDAEIVMFSPQHAHKQVIEHMIAKTGG
ncbi:MAG: cupin domain-containing protein [Dehalococcoidia bacterium]|nr:cupin domain-containing protein [Dehalococcoidia bacterium]MCA9843264.1 cupin domain-containing protein [Dehalococcoidia bacterium]MCA9852495.1 cupin domain-containing protein [Dehalococcoidia bacterium]